MCHFPLSAAGSPFVCTRREAGRGWRRTGCFCICSTSWAPFPPSSYRQLSSPDHPSYNDRLTRYGTRRTAIAERFQAGRIGVKLSAEAEADITDREGSAMTKERAIAGRGGRGETRISCKSGLPPPSFSFKGSRQRVSPYPFIPRPLPTLLPFATRTNWGTAKT